MRRVTDPNEANHCIIFSTIDGKVIAKFYYDLDISIECAMMIQDIYWDNPHLARNGIRMDIAGVRNGRVFVAV